MSYPITISILGLVDISFPKIKTVGTIFRSAYKVTIVSNQF